MFMLKVVLVGGQLLGVSTFFDVGPFDVLVPGWLPLVPALTGRVVTALLILAYLIRTKALWFKTIIPIL